MVGRGTREGSNLSPPPSEDDPEPQIGVEAGAAFLDGRNLGREARGLRPLRADRKEEDEIAVRPGKANANGDRPLFLAFGFSLVRFPRPEVGIANDGGGLDIVIAHDFSSSAA